MAGRGGYYGALHPAYQAFSDHSVQNAARTPDDASFTPSGRHGIQPAAAASSGSSASTKLDEILALLHNQEEKISSLKSEVYLFSYHILNTRYI